MTPRPSAPIQSGSPLAPGMRVLLVIAGTLVLLAGVQLFVFSERTATYFAWTIDPPLTAAFLGAGYWASVVLEWYAARARTWERARIAVPGVFVFTALTLIATLVHLDRFHLGVDSMATRVVTWAWIAIYSIVPPMMVVLAVLQRRVTGSDAPRRRPLPGPLRAGLALHGSILGALGLALFLAPERTFELWPWTLTPLTARAVAAWLLGISVVAVHAVIENDGLRIRAGSASYAALGFLQLVALARFPSDLEGGPGAALYVLMVASALGLGVWGWMVGRDRPELASAAPPGRDERAIAS